MRYADASYVVHAGIRPDRPINRQEKDHCIHIRTWNPKTKKISNEGIDPWWYEYPYLYSSQRHHCPPSIKIFFGHQRHDKDGSLTGHAHWMAVLYLVGHYECMWGTKGFWRSTPKEPMNWTKKKGLHHLLLQFDLLAKEL